MFLRVINEKNTEHFLSPEQLTINGVSLGKVVQILDKQKKQINVLGEIIARQSDLLSTMEQKIKELTNFISES